MLLKGVNKRVIVIKNPESEIFEEAYFIIKSGNLKGAFKQAKENEMVIEANRIISDYHSQQRSMMEKNGVASGISGDLSELDNFLNSGVKNDTAGKISKSGGIGNSGKNKKDSKSKSSPNTDLILNPGSNPSETTNIENTEGTASAVPLPGEDIFEDEKFFENMGVNRDSRDYTEKYGNLYSDPDFAAGYGHGYHGYYGDGEYGGYKTENKAYKSAFGFISSKKLKNINKTRKIPMPPKSFFVGVGFMSAIIILIRLFELVVLN